MHTALVLTEAEVRRVLSIKEANDLVEECFRSIGQGLGENVPTSGITFREPPGRCSIKSGYLRERAALGIKIIRVHNGNPVERQLPMMHCQIVLIDGETGELRGIVDGVYITRVRTGSAGAVGGRFLARPQAARIAVVGAGVQGRAQLQAIAADRSLERVWVWSRSRERREAYSAEMSKELGISIAPTASVEEACRQAEIIVTATWAYEPIVDSRWVQPGTYIAAIGADAPGMQELDPILLQRAKVVVDDLEQCMRMGEINVPVRDGTYNLEQVHATIGEIAAGLKVGRVDKDEITIFDSTGIGVQDAVAADHAYQKAKSMSIGTWVTM